MPSIEVLPSNGENMEKQRKRILDHHKAVLIQAKDRYQDVLAELFFLQNGGNMMDFFTWKKKPPAMFMDYVKSQPIESSDHETVDRTPITSNEKSEVVISKPPLNSSQNATPVKSNSYTRSLSLPTTAKNSGTPHVGRPATTVMTPEQIVEKAKQEAHVMQRIAELQREGLWSEKRLPKVAEPPRAKTHWDYLLEEMVWLAGDFSAERKWKKAAAKKCARMVQKYFQEKAAAAAKAEKEEEQRLRKIASFVAKEIRTFWSNVEKLVDYKQKTRLEEKRKKVLDQHLNFIVLETEKYSSWLTEGLSKPAKEVSAVEEVPRKTDSDVEFEPDVTSSDDEETIAQEEKMDTDNEISRAEREKAEIEALKRESEMPLEDLLNDLPPDYFEDRVKTEVAKEQEADVSDEEFEVDSDDSVEDDEETIDQAEKEELEDNESNTNELQELEAEMDMPLEKLLAKYNNPDEEADEENQRVEEQKQDDEEEHSTDSEGLSGESDSDMDVDVDLKESFEMEDQKDLGIESLLDDNASGGEATTKLSDAAALAESFQPKGNTLESTQVIAKVPFLLKHSLREYQHIGLDWMAAMYERKLNGILADEMGLGKTIQTIALLAWLACEKGIWGPHLVVVPTSVMLNWEMEFKKWCPSFKILTYYGTQKDRKQKRMGWTKPNAFHVCITSYKLVIQDHQAFRRKRWRYFILDEAQNIKNFKSQRWQLLLNFQSQRRLLLTGTPLQNNLMELWSLMHFLMPDIFGSHRDFREWFSNPVTGMIEGSAEYNESVIRRLHKVLRPFILRRLKSEVEKQLPQKYEHIVMCRLSKRQRYLYDDFMSRARTKETLASGNLLSVINVLMQLRKVCNHPNLFEPRPIVSPFQMEPIVYYTASLVYGLLDYDPFQNINLSTFNLLLADLELTLTAFAAHRVRRFQAPVPLIEEIDTAPPAPPPCPRGKIRLHVRPSNPQQQTVSAIGRSIPVIRTSIPGGASRPGAPQVLSTAGGVAFPQQPRLAAPAPSLPSAAVAAATSGAVTRPQVQLQFVQHSGALHTISIPNAQGGASVGQVPATSPRELLSVPLPQGGEARLAFPSVAQQITNAASVVPSCKSIQDGTADSVGSRLVTSRTPLVISMAGTPGRPTVVTPQTPVRVVSQSNQTASPTISPASTVGVRNRVSVDTFNTVQNGPDHASEIRRPCKWNYDRSLFKTNAIDEKKRQERRERLAFLAKLNKKRCEACPIYGSDLIEAVTITTKLEPAKDGHLNDGASDDSTWSGLGRSYVSCLHASSQLKNSRRNYLTLWSETNALRSMLLSSEQRIEEMKEIIQRFVICSSAVSVPPIVFHVSHPPPARLWSEQKRELILKSELAMPASPLHCIQSAMMTQFPDPRLIQYDCGKLQTLDKLLRQLKADKHRVLIFTQMTRMLDVLEAFLNYHGHIYLRLDGTTRVDQRQVLMERFNADRRIFCFILSTRSGGIGVNLTGADTVIFYDSDWNPTMDAQAQDRCHRIGQTRDVHIYRLISEKTVEENILKKANQKRLLGDIAIEGGNFTAATFKKQTIHDLFEVDLEEADASKRMAEVLDKQKADQQSTLESSEVPAETSQSWETSQGSNDPSTAAVNTKAALGILESALAAAEDETDVAAARTVRAEAAAEMAEFDESSPIGVGEDSENAIVDGEIKKAEAELLSIEDQLTPVERYAMRFMESSEECWSAEQLRAAEAQIEEQKKAWELKRLASLNCNDEEHMDPHSTKASPCIEPENGLLTFAHRDSVNQIWVSMDGSEIMPMWCPPTPPQNDNDVYMDYASSYLYEDQIMEESRLPPVFVRKELKRVRKESVQIQPDDGRRPAKIRKEETVYAPRSLFDRPSPALAKLRRDLKLQKFRGIVRPPIPLNSLSLKAPALPVRPIEESENTPEWLVHEDWILLQAVQNLLELPLNLVILTPAHTPNWDLVADLVNSYSRSYRSPKQCRNRYISVILPREEGKAAAETSPKKMKKTKALIRPNQQQQPQQQLQPPQQPSSSATNSKSGVGNRPMRTSQLYAADSNNSFTNVWHQRFDTLKGIFHKKAPTNRTMLSTSTSVGGAARSANNAKHAGVLQDAGIVYDSPLNPVQVAAVRAERIAQKQKTALAEQLQAQQQAQQQQQPQQQPQQQVQQQQRAGSVPVASPANGASLTPGSPAPTARLTPVPVASPATTVLTGQTAVSSSAPTPPTAVVMNTLGHTATAGQHTLLLQGTGQTNLQSGTSQQQLILQPTTPGGIRAQRHPVTTLTMQDVVAGSNQIRTQQPGQLSTTGAPSVNLTGQTVVTVSNLTTVQVQSGSHLLTSAGVAVSGTQLNTITTTAAGSVKGASVTVVQTTPTPTMSSPATGTSKAPTQLTPTQLQYFRQQVLVKQQHQQRLQEQQLKKLQLSSPGTISGAAQGLGPAMAAAAAAAATGQKVPLVTVSAASITATPTTLSNFTSVQIASAGQTPQGARTQLIKGGTALIGKGGTAVARTIVTDAEMAALIKRQQQIQQQQQQQKAGAAAAGGSGLQTNASQQQTTVQIGTASTTGITTAQLLTQTGLQVQTAPAAGSQTQMATLVKTVSAPATLDGAPSVTIPVSAISVGLPQVQVKGLTATGVKATAATQQQLRQFTIQHQALIQQRKAQQQQQPKTGQLAQTVTLGTVKGNVVSVPQQLGTAVGTVQLVQPVASGTGSTVGGAGGSGSKPGLSTTMTMQQLQQMIRQVTAGNAQVLVSSPSSGGNAATSGTALLAKAPQGQTVQARVIPVTQQGLKQTIQVVTTGQPGSAAGTTRVATLSAAAGSAVGPGLASALAAGTWKVAGGTDAQQKALLSQVSAALQSGQPVSLAVRAGPNVGAGPSARILTAGTAFSTAVVAAPVATVTSTQPTAGTTSSATNPAVATPTSSAHSTVATTTSSATSSVKTSDPEPPTEN